MGTQKGCGEGVRFGRSLRVFGSGDARAGILLLVPALIFIAAVVAWPLVRAIWLSFHKLYLIKGFDSIEWAGLDNFVKFLQNPRTPSYLLNVLILLVGTVVGRLTFGMALALLMNRPMPFRWLFRGLAVLPWCMPAAVTAVVWKWIYDGEWGILNYVLTRLGIIDNYITFLGSETWVWPSIIIVGIWNWYAFSYVSILAALQTIPHEIYEQAEIDGSNEFSTFWRITLPMLRPVLAVLILLEIIWTIRDFATVWTLTEGGPGHFTMTLSPLVYLTSFKYLRMGYGASIGVWILLISLVFTVIYLRRVRFEVD